MSDNKRSAIVVAVFLMVSAVMLYGNAVTKKGGILDDTLLNHDDPYYKMDQEVKALQKNGLKTGDPISFVITSSGGLKELLEKTDRFTKALRERFPDYGIMSLTTVTHYEDTGTELISDPYLQKNWQRGFDEKDWIRKVSTDPAVYGVLIGKHLDFTQVFLLPSIGYDEIGVYRAVVSLLENRNVAWYEWFLKTDIKPQAEFVGIRPAGWVMARGLIDAGFVGDVLKLSIFGMIITCAAAFLQLRSGRQAIICTLLIAFGIVWVRGSVGLLQKMGFPLYERVYILLVYTAIIVAGISFFTRCFETFNDQGAANYWFSWGKAFSSVLPPIMVAALLSIENFATLYQIEIRGILEVGIFSALGIVYLVIFSVFVLPALQVLLKAETASEEKAGVLSKAWHKALQFCVRVCYGFSNPRQNGRSAAVAVSITVLAAAALIFVFFSGRIEVKTRPLEYIRNTVVYEASEILNRKENRGFDSVTFLAVPKTGNVENPKFLEKVRELSLEGREIKGVRQVNSILDTVEVVSKASYHKTFPDSEQEAHDIFQLIDGNLNSEVARQLWFENGVVLFVTTAADDSNVLSEMTDRVYALSKKFDLFELRPFGKLAVYPKSDQYIREGKPLNVVTSQWMVIVTLAVWIWYVNCRKRFFSRWSPLQTGIVMNIPFVFALGVVAVIMWLLKVPLDQATACATALAINAAADFGIYLVADYHSIVAEGGNHVDGVNFALLQNGKKIVGDMLLNILCFAPLTISRFSGIYRLGWVMIAMLLACGFGSLALMPPLLGWSFKKKQAVSPSIVAA